VLSFGIIAKPAIKDRDKFVSLLMW
jgi:hypothetical protein